MVLFGLAIAVWSAAMLLLLLALLLDDTPKPDSLDPRRRRQKGPCKE